MPFIRHAHDKRGYDSTLVMHAYRPASGPARTKVLYLFRSPSHVQVGRKALDPEVREALEHTHPDLTFDWNGLLRDAPPIQRQPRPEHGQGRERGGKAARAGRQARPERPTPPPREVPDDDSPLGQAVGATDAQRLRQRYAELMQRITRRSRTPEERDVLTAQLLAHNPDDWRGADAIRQQAAAVVPVWDALAAQLPKRRRGRRGGKGDEPGQVADSDVIIGERDQTDDVETYDHADAVRPGGDSDPERAAEAAAESASADDPESDVHQPG
ncbi:MAG: hypothetical protein AB7L71_14425 [Vicinamibacterales bacterium]|jgi:hypothetical protein